MDTRIIKCPICGDPYEVYAYYAGDQSACSECRNKAKKKLREKQSDSFTGIKVNDEQDQRKAMD